MYRIVVALLGAVVAGNPLPGTTADYAIGNSQLGAAPNPKQVVILVAPFAGKDALISGVGKRTSAILNLQIWQTLRIPTTAEGKGTKGTVTWGFGSRPPSTFLEADSYAAAQREQEPAILLWGRAWHYANGDIVESFLNIRSGGTAGTLGSALWSIKLADSTRFAVGVPRRQIEFEPIILRAELMPELSQPAGLKLYKSAYGDETEGFVGDYFTALEQGPESAKVVLPNGTQGWVRLPSLSREHSEVADFSGGVVRILRSDWPGAIELFRRVVDNAHAPTAVKIDSYLYLAIAMANSNGDPRPWIQKAYKLNPYSKTTLEYLCMAQLADLWRAQNDNSGRVGNGEEQLRALTSLVQQGKPLYSKEDPWFARLRSYLENQPTGNVENPYGLPGLWAGGDFVVRSVLIVLLIMSLASWYVMLTKLWDQRKLKQDAWVVEKQFWTAPSVKDGVERLRMGDEFRAIAEDGLRAASQHDGTLTGRIDLQEWITISQQRADQVNSRLNTGLGLLATVGSVAPFVGLFGTVWGILNALVSIGVGHASVDKVAGPVGEALIMTAIGLLVAVPATLGYNWLLGRNKVLQDVLRNFANDLHTHLVSGARASVRGLSGHI